MTHIQADDSNVDIDLGSLFFAVKRNIVKILIAVLAVGFIAFVIVNLMDEQYRSEARILIDSREPVFNNNPQLQTNPVANVLDERGVSSQVEILKSNNLVKTVARELDLASYDEFDAPKTAPFLSGIFISLGLMADPYKIPAEERVLKEFYKKLDVYQVEQSRVIAIEFTSENADLAAKVPNAMANVFLRVQSGEKLKDNSAASAWLEPEIERLRESVRKAEAEVADYRAEKGLFLIGNSDTLKSQQLSDISAELTRVRSEMVDAEARAKTVRKVLENGQDIDSVANVLNSPTIQRLRDNEANVRADIADLSTTLLEGHPRMQALRSQLVDIQGQLRTEARKVLASLENEASVARLREKELQASLNNFKADSAQAGGEEVQLRALEREAASQRELLETYLSQYREATSRTQASAVPPNARVISQAIEPTEVHFPRKMPFVLAAMFAASIISVIWVMLAELFSGRALRPVSPSAATGSHYPMSHHNNGHYPSQGQPYYQGQNGMPYPIAPENLGDDADAFKAQMMPEEVDGRSIHEVVAEYQIATPSMVLFLSPEGDATVAGSVLLARRLADENVRTILLDLTLDGAPTGVTLGTSRIRGLTNLLCGEASISDTIHPDRKSNAHVMARGNGNVQRAMRAFDRIPIIIDALTENYDLVIVECGSTSVQGILSLAQNFSPEFIVSAKHLPPMEAENIKAQFSASGYHDVMVLDLKKGQARPTPVKKDSDKKVEPDVKPDSPAAHAS